MFLLPATKKTLKIILYYADVDECSEGIHKCNRSGPTAAGCANIEGGYRCTCDAHVGFRLSMDNTTCEGIRFPQSIPS